MYGVRFLTFTEDTQIKGCISNDLILFSPLQTPFKPLVAIIFSLLKGRGWGAIKNNKSGTIFIYLFQTSDHERVIDILSSIKQKSKTNGL